MKLRLRRLVPTIDGGSEGGDGLGAETERLGGWLLDPFPVVCVGHGSIMPLLLLFLGGTRVSVLV